MFSWFANFFRNGESRKLTREQRSLIIYAYNLVIKISANTAVGKEGKFHIFILLTLRSVYTFNFFFVLLLGLLRMLLHVLLIKILFKKSIIIISNKFCIKIKF